MHVAVPTVLHFNAVVSSSCHRLDYLYAHPEAVPSLEGAASQINQLKREQGVWKVFLTSDAPAKGTYVEGVTGSGSRGLQLTRIRTYYHENQVKMAL